MSTAAQVQAAWKTAVFDHADIQAISTKAYGYAITEDSETELAALFDSQHINFFQYLVGRGQQLGTIGVVNYTYVVEVSYYRAKDPTGANWQAVRDAFDTLFARVQEGLSYTWSNTVDGWQSQQGPAEIVEGTIGVEPCWIGRFTFTGFKQAAF